jgi:succinate-semialdehyde dehydrogenase/glutarate-semialdehyde dehydrogenase
MSYPTLKHYIDGRWVEPTGGSELDVVNPADNRPIGKLGLASRDDLDLALAAAERGFRQWRGVASFERGKILRKAAELVRARAEEIGKVLTLEQGKIFAEAKLEVLSAADIIDWFAGEGQRAYGRVIPARADGVRNMVLLEPIGPVAGFAPWNFPVTQAVRKVAAALAAGCSIILKCPEETPAAPIGLVNCFHDAGVPAGVINLVYGVPAEIS